MGSWFGPDLGLVLAGARAKREQGTPTPEPESMALKGGSRRPVAC